MLVIRMADFALCEHPRSFGMLLEDRMLLSDRYH
jgi:hypothetical protein